MHGLIFFYLQKFIAPPSTGATVVSRSPSTRTTSAAKGTHRYLPSGIYPDADAVAILQSFAADRGLQLPDVIEHFGEFLAPHLIKVAGTSIDPGWRSLDLVEHTEEIIHAMVRRTNPGAMPPVLETVRVAPDELHLVYTSARRMCRLARGLIRGMARHFGESIDLTEPSCMLRGDPFCSFVLMTNRPDTADHGLHEPETLEFATSSERGWTNDDIDIRISAEEPPPPVSVGGHRVVRLIGTGGMGRVWLAHDDRLDRDVAVKVMLPSKAKAPASRERFLRESRAAAQVDHPHVVRIHHIGEEDGLPFIVMPFLEGPTLAEHLRRTGRLELPEALRIAGEIASGLAAAHRRGLIHRDIKTENVVLVGPARNVVIIDFGLARDTLVDAHSLTLDGMVIGTPAYMAPERAAERPVDGRADLFGLGVILYELIAGRLPFEGRSAVAMLASIARGQPIPLASAAPGVPEAACRLVMEMIAHDPADRPADAETVSNRIEALRRGLTA